VEARKQRAHARVPRRVSCDVLFRGTRHVGVAMNLSAGGFFVQTSAAPELGSTVWVTLHPSGKSQIDVEARVTNRRRVPPSLATVSRPGVGCSVCDAPEAYYHLLAELGV
jgi:hypothetical protein